LGWMRRREHLPRIDGQGPHQVFGRNEALGDPPLAVAKILGHEQIPQLDAVPLLSCGGIICGGDLVKLEPLVPRYHELAVRLDGQHGMGRGRGGWSRRRRSDRGFLPEYFHERGTQEPSELLEIPVLTDEARVRPTRLEALEEPLYALVLGHIDVFAIPEPAAS